MAVPVLMPVTMPVVLPTVAMLVLLLLHAPPATDGLNVAIAAGQSAVAPVTLSASNGFTRIVSIVRLQPSSLLSNLN